MCYGCDEGRDRYVITVRRKLHDIVVREQACVGCMKFLDSVRLFSIPFVQIYSHKGNILWAISPQDYYEHQKLFDAINVTERKWAKVGDYDHDCKGYDQTTNNYFDSKDEDIMTFNFSDGGDEDVDQVRAFLMAGLIESKEYQKRTLTTV